MMKILSEMASPFQNHDPAAVYPASKIGLMTYICLRVRHRGWRMLSLMSSMIICVILRNLRQMTYYIVYLIIYLVFQGNN